MTKLTLTNCVQGYATLVENEIIDWIHWQKRMASM